MDGAALSEAEEHDDPEGEETDTAEGHKVGSFLLASSRRPRS